MADLFFIPPGNVVDDLASFQPGESIHIQRSCRKGIGDRVRATDGEGRWLTVLITGTGKRVTGRVLEIRKSEPEPLRMDLAVGVSRRERMSWLIEKGTEIGMSSLTPLLTSWSQARRSHEDWEGHISRWRRVAIAALKQSHRSFLPEIRSPLPLERFLEKARSAPYDLKVFLDPGEESSPIGSLLGGGMKRFLILLGPEGGFSALEVSRIVAEGFLRGRIIGRPLRFETAGIIAMAAIAMRVEGGR